MLKNEEEMLKQLAYVRQLTYNLEAQIVTNDGKRPDVGTKMAAEELYLAAKELKKALR